jgi:hypothetical protein
MPGYLRLRRTMRLAPGVRINLSKSGLSTSFGPRGLHYTVGHGRRRATIGIPGSGVSYTTYSHTHARSARAAAPLSSASTTSGGLEQLAGLTPPQKIAYGIVLTLLVVTSPVGLWLLITGVWQLHLPEWRIRTYVRRASNEPARAAALLAAAAAIDPQSPDVLAPLAELHASQGDPTGAAAYYREYCTAVPGDWLARGHLALAELQSNQVDAAIADLVAIRQEAPVTGDSRASITAHLAYAYLCRQDPQQALSLVEAAPSGASSAGPGGEQCLFYSAVSRYMLGHTDAAVRELDHLYAVNPGHEGVQAAKNAMSTGTYELMLPDGSVLVPLAPGHVSRSAVIVQRRPPLSPHCPNCQAPLRANAVECAYCHTGVIDSPTTVEGPHAQASPAAPPPPSPPPA